MGVEDEPGVPQLIEAFKTGSLLKPMGIKYIQYNVKLVSDDDEPWGTIRSNLNRSTYTWTIFQVKKDGQWYRRGIRAGWQITRVEGKKVNSRNYADIHGIIEGKRACTIEFSVPEKSLTFFVGGLEGIFQHVEFDYSSKPAVVKGIRENLPDGFKIDPRVQPGCKLINVNHEDVGNKDKDEIDKLLQSTRHIKLQLPAEDPPV